MEPMTVSYWTLAGSHRGGRTRPRSASRCRVLIGRLRGVIPGMIPAAIARFGAMASRTPASLPSEGLGHARGEPLPEGDLAGGVEVRAHVARLQPLGRDE